jgi:hypothetical protein
MQKQIRNFAFLALALPLVLASCYGTRGEGGIVQEDRAVQNFHALDVSIPGRVVVHIDSAYSVRVQAEESILPYLETELDGSTLRIFFSRSVYDADDVVVTVSGPNFDGFDISGSASITCDDAIDGATLRADVSGSGDLRLPDADFDRIEAEISGSGDIVVKGKADQLDAEVSGSGNLSAEDCPVANADVRVSGSGELRCNVSGLLKARVSGSGDVRYRGQPQLDVSISGSGEVKPL